MYYLVPIHQVAAIIWVGGMFFAHMALRPAAQLTLEPPARLALFASTFRQFFRWVWISVIALLITGFILLFSYFGGMKGAPVHVHLMLTLGLVMTGIYAFIFFVPYQKLKQHVTTQEWPAAGGNLALIRKLVVTNLTLGLIIVITTASGRYLGL
jgi:uncharacterized membrane protein